MEIPSGLMVARLMPSSHDSVGAAGGGGGGCCVGPLGLLQPVQTETAASVQNSKLRAAARLEPNDILGVIDCTKRALEALAYRGRNS
jgi:hypothetical protein